MRKVESVENREIQDVPYGEYVKILKSNGEAMNRVYIRQEYDKSEKAFWLQAWDDISYGRYVKKGKMVRVGFTF